MSEKTKNIRFAKLVRRYLRRHQRLVAEAKRDRKPAPIVREGNHYWKKDKTG